MKEEPKKEDIIHIVQRNTIPLVFIEKNKNILSPTFTMKWEKDAREILDKVPEKFIDFVIKNAESFAQKKGYAKVTGESLAEQMEETRKGP